MVVKAKKVLAFLALIVTAFTSANSFSSEQTMEQKKLVLILLGPPGAGKGTQAALLKDRLHLPSIATGDLLRENVRQNTSLGQEAKGYMEKGQLVPDPLILEMLFKRISEKDCEKGYMLDGFPRTIAQAEALQVHLKDEKVIAVDLKLSDEIIIERLAKRISCEKCGTPYHLIFSPPKKADTCDTCGGRLIQRNDDKEEVIKQRLAVYHKQTAPLIDYYAKKKLLHTINMDASKSKEKTFKEILAIVEKG